MERNIERQAALGAAAISIHRDLTTSELVKFWGMFKTAADIHKAAWDVIPMAFYMGVNVGITQEKGERKKMNRTHDQERAEIEKVLRERPEILELLKAFDRVPTEKKAEALAVALEILQNAEPAEEQ